MNEKENQVIKALNQNPFSMAEAARLSGLPFKTFEYHARKLGVYQPNQSGRGRRNLNKGPKKGPKGRIPILEILEGKHPSYKRAPLKRRLLAEGIKENKCEECGITEWKDNLLSMHLDHINGVNNDHRLKNLRMLCPNCHSQTPTYCGRNKAAVAQLAEAPDSKSGHV